MNFGVVVAPSMINWTGFFALQALVECLGICIATLGLKFPILLNWVKFRPGICDSGATSSTGRGATESSPTWGCLGLAPSRLSKQRGMDIFPIFLLRLGSSHLMWIASLASLVTWEGSLSIMLKSSMEGRGWWKSLQCRIFTTLFLPVLKHCKVSILMIRVKLTLLTQQNVITS